MRAGPAFQRALEFIEHLSEKETCMQNLAKRIGFLCLSIALTRGVAVSAETESLRFGLDPAEFFNWVVGHSQSNDTGSILEMVPKGETVDNYTKILTQLSFSKAKAKFPAPEDHMKLLKESMLRKCPNVVWNVIEKIGKDILYEWRIENCSPNPDQHNIVRIFDGKYNRFQLMYMRKTKELPAEERDQWLKVLREAKVVIENK
jgi:hypothetical protein